MSGSTDYEFDCDDFARDLKIPRWKSVALKVWVAAKNQALLIFTLVGVVLGIVIGIALRSKRCPEFYEKGTNGCTLTADDVFYLEFPGVLLMNLLKMIILPLIFTSMIASLSKLTAETSGKLGGVTVTVFFSTTIVSVVIALILVLTIQPGAGGGGEHTNHTNGTGGEEQQANTVETLLDVLRNLCPRSIVEASFLTATTVMRMETRTFRYNDSATYVKNISVPYVEYNDGMNALGIIGFSLVFGAILSKGGPTAKIVKDFNDELMRVVMLMVTIIIWYSPIGIMFLLMAKMVEIEDLSELWGSLGMYILTDVSASLIHMFIVLPLVMLAICRQNPFKHFVTFSQAILTAFATSSSGATLATSIHCAENGAQVDSRISRFVLPLGATIHMDGTAIYQCISAIYLAQLAGIKMNAGKVIVAAIMSMFAAVSAPGVPQGAIVNIVMVLGAIGVPTTEIRLLYTTDWLLDRVQTSINVFGDCLCCLIAQKFLQKDLKRLDEAKLEEIQNEEIHIPRETSTSKLLTDDESS